MPKRGCELRPFGLKIVNPATELRGFSILLNNCMQQNEFVSQWGPNVIMAVPRYTHMRAFDGYIIIVLPERRTIDMCHKVISEGFYT